MLLKISVSVILLWLVFRQLDRAIFIEIIKNVDKRLILLAFFILFINYVLFIFRWEMLLKAAQIHLPLSRVIISSAGGHFFSLFLPSTIGGDVVRVIDLTTHTRKPHEVMATVLLDRLSGYVGLVILTWLALLSGFKHILNKNVLVCVGILTTILIVILLVLFNKFLYHKINMLLNSPSGNKIRGYIRDVHKEMHIFRHREKVALNNIILSIFIQMITSITFYITALSLGLKINMIYFFIFMPIIGAITLLPISIGGLGLREYTTRLFFANLGVSAHLTFAMSLVNSFFILIYGGMGGLIYVLTVHHRRIQYNPPHHFHKTHA